MYFQVFSNFAFLEMVDAALVLQFPALVVVPRPVSTLTAVIWVLSLVTSPAQCPAIVKFMSLVHIVLAFRFAPMVGNSPIELWALGGFVLVTVLHLLVSSKKIIVTSEIILYVTLISTKMVGLHLLAASSYGGVLAEHSSKLLSVFAVIIVLLCCQRDPVKGSVLFGSFGASTLSVLIDQHWLLLLSYAYSASLLQGLAHALSREQPTLIKLQNDADREQKIAHEWGHVVFFPNLLLHAIYTTLTGGVTGTSTDKKK